MKRLGFNSIVALICFVVGLSAFSLWGFVRLRSRVGIPPVRIEPMAAPPASQLIIVQPDSPDSRIRRVDFMNFTYPNKSRSYREVTSEIKLKNGKFEFYDPKEHFLWLVEGETDDIIYADLTGDGEEEAIIDLFSHSGMSGGEHFLYVYTMTGYPRLLWFFETYGSGSDIGGAREMYVQDGALVLELNGRNTIKRNGSTVVDEYMCDQCYKEFTRVRFKWDGERFKQKGRVEIHPLPGGQN